MDKRNLDEPIYISNLRPYDMKRSSESVEFPELNFTGYDNLDYLQTNDLTYIIEELNNLLTPNLIISDDIFVTDPNGYIIFIKKITHSINSSLISQGACLSIDSIGNNAVGLALQNLTPTKCEGKEHSLIFLHDKVSLGLPILKDEKLIGCVGLITDNTSQINVVKNIIEMAINAASRMLEASQSIDELYLLKDFFKKLDNTKGMILIDINLDIIQANRKAELILGINKEELIGKNIRNFLDSIPFLPGLLHKQYYKQLAFNTINGKIKIDATILPSVLPNARILGWGLQFTSIDKSTNKPQTTKPVKFEFKDIIGQNKEFVRLINLAKSIAKSPSNVLITGASGTGKELFAQAIHYASYCSEGPFVAVNCAAIPSELMEAEFFGYVEGAFTGAKKGGMEGKFLKANGGTLFLDEIGDMPLALQPKLLRVLQDRVINRIGCNKPIPVDIRLISATNQDIAKMVADNKFRADLYYRLNVVNLQIPPLNKRKDDIPLLTEHLLNIYNAKLKKDVSGISPEALECLMEYEWPGNVRELENVIERAVNLADDIIEVEDIKPNLFEQDEEDIDEPVDFIASLEEVEKKQIIKALYAFGGNVANAASTLEIGRTTLYRKIKKYNLLDLVK